MELSRARSLLFVPGNDERKLAKALASPADAVVCDLEDAVAPGDKEEARETVARVLAGADAAGMAAGASATGRGPAKEDGSTAATGTAPHPGWGVVPPPTPPSVAAESAPDRDDFAPTCAPARLVRVNAPGTPWFEDDLALAAALPLDGVVLPKASPEAIAALDSLGAGGAPVVAIVETARGVREAFEIASSKRVLALLLGAVDLAADAGLEPRADALEILYARSKIALDSAAAGLRGPFDAVHLELTDLAGLEEQCRLARSLGFRGKACIHPAQIDTVNRVFAPDDAEVAWAREVVQAFERQEHGVLAVGGVMVDRPVVERARQILEAAERSERR